jgi:hypothetical protein
VVVATGDGSAGLDSRLGLTSSLVGGAVSRLIGVAGVVAAGSTEEEVGDDSRPWSLLTDGFWLPGWFVPAGLLGPVVSPVEVGLPGRVVVVGLFVLVGPVLVGLPVSAGLAVLVGLLVPAGLAVLVGLLVPAGLAVLVGLLVPAGLVVLAGFVGLFVLVVLVGPVPDGLVVLVVLLVTGRLVVVPLVVAPVGSGALVVAMGAVSEVSESTVYALRGSAIGYTTEGV